MRSLRLGEASAAARACGEAGAGEVVRAPVAPAPPARRVGRRRYEPTAKQRGQVALCVASGIDQDVIARMIGISPKTLRRHFSIELETAYATIKAEIAGKLIAAARGGDIHAIVFYLATHGWSSKVVVPDGGLEEIDLSKLTDGEIASRLARLRRGATGGGHLSVVKSTIPGTA